MGRRQNNRYNNSLLTVGLRLPDGVAETETAGQHVEHGDVVGGRCPPGERQQQTGVERRAGNDDVDAPDVRRGHVTHSRGRDGTRRSVGDDDESDAMNSERAVHVRLNSTTTQYN